MHVHACLRVRMPTAKGLRAESVHRHVPIQLSDDRAVARTWAMRAPMHMHNARAHAHAQYARPCTSRMAAMILCSPSPTTSAPEKTIVGPARQFGSEAIFSLIHDL